MKYGCGRRLVRVLVRVLPGRQTAIPVLLAGALRDVVGELPSLIQLVRRNGRVDATLQDFGLVDRLVVGVVVLLLFVLVELAEEVFLVQD